LPPVLGDRPAEAPIEATDHQALFLRQRRERMQYERIDVRAKFSDQEGYAVSYQPTDEVNVAAQAV
jgi:hypothetical protein